MNEYCAISTRNFSCKEVDKFGKVTILRKGIGLEIELKRDIDDPVEKKLQKYEKRRKNYFGKT